MPALRSSASVRLALTAAAGLVLVTLGWAGLRLREVLRRNESLQNEAAASGRMLREAQAETSSLREAAAKAEGLQAQTARLKADLEKTEAALKATPAPAPEAARVQELEQLVAFLREEITAARETISRMEKEAAERKSAGTGRDRATTRSRR